MKLLSIVSLANLSISFFLFMLPPLAYYIYNHVLTNCNYLDIITVDNFHKTVDNYLAHELLSADPSGAGTPLPYYQHYDWYEQMENGERQGKN